MVVLVPPVLIPALTLTGCSGSPDPGPFPTTTRADGSRAFGDSFVYGTKPGEEADPEHSPRVTVVDLGTYDPGSAVKTEKHHAACRQYRVVVTNTTAASWDLPRFRVVGLDGDRTADTVNDKDKGIGVAAEASPSRAHGELDPRLQRRRGFPAVRVAPRNDSGTFPVALFKP